ncbi:hypothetical protein [Streptomyces hydrogenans]
MNRKTANTVIVLLVATVGALIGGLAASALGAPALYAMGAGLTAFTTFSMLGMKILKYHDGEGAAP